MKIRHNHIAIWLLVALHQVITVIWYSPVAFYHLWMEEQGRDMSRGTRDPLPFITGVICSVLLCYTISWLVQVLHKDTWRKGTGLGLILFSGLAASTLAPHYKYLDLSMAVLFIDLGLTMVVMVVTSAILAVWRVAN